MCKLALGFIPLKPGPRGHGLWTAPPGPVAAAPSSPERLLRLEAGLANLWGAGPVTKAPITRRTDEVTGAGLGDRKQMRVTGR